MAEDLLIPNLKGRSIPCFLYADNFVLLSLIPKDLQISFDILSQYSKLSRLEVNGAKSINMVIRKGNNSKRDEVWIYDGVKMPTGTSFQYLGVRFFYGRLLAKALQVSPQGGQNGHSHDSEDCIAGLRFIHKSCPRNVQYTSLLSGPIPGGNY